MSNGNETAKGMGRRRGPMGGRGMTPGEKPKDLKGAIGKLASYIRHFKFAIVIVAVFAACSTVFSVIGPKILGKATTALSEGLMAKIRGTGGIDFTYIGKILLFVLGLYLLSALFSFVQGWIMTGVTQKICYQLRKEISEKINRMPMKYFESRTYGEVLSRITNDVDTLGQGLNQSITTIITSVATLIGVFIMMLSISPLMTLIALVILPVSAGLISFVVKKSQKYFKNQQEYLGHINGQVEEIYGGHLVIKAFNREQDTIEEFDATNQKLYESAWKSQFLSGMMQPIMMFVGNLGYAAVALSGGLLAIRGTITIGDIQAFIQYVKSFTQPIQQIARVIADVISAQANIERVTEMLETKPTIVDSPAVIEKYGDTFSPKKENWEPIRGDIEFKDVTFKYPDGNEYILEHFNLKIPAGTTVAIVGETGAGKSTLVNIACRFFEPTEGQVLIDGKDYRERSQLWLHSSLGYVLQNPHLFSGTVRENIRYGRLDATDQEIKEAAKIVSAHELILSMENGYDSDVGESGDRLSTGEKQLISFARAVLADPRIFVLDEATSSIDTKTEQLIQDAIAHLLKNRTSFLIAHRLSTIRKADIILVVRDGKIIEQGTHEGLLKKQGYYYTLYRNQFEQELSQKTLA